MSPSRRNAPISSWEAGDTVSGFALLTRKERRQDKNGRDYLDLRLADASGSIGARVWSDSPALDGDYEAHDFVAFKGSVKSYRDALQVSIQECRRTTDADRRLGLDPKLLIPATREDLDDLWRRLEAIYPGAIGRPPLARLVRETLAVHGAALREHPAAKAMHHAYLGGLLEHVVSMAEVAQRVCAAYPAVDADLVLVGVLFHDLGKLRELGAMPVNDYTAEGRLVGHVVIGRDLLLARCAAIPDFPEDLRLHLEHLVLSHQGRLEFGSPVAPMTAEALVLHFVDNLDSKLAQLRDAAESGSGFQFVRGLGRFVWVGPEGQSGTAADENGTAGDESGTAADENGTAAEGDGTAAEEGGTAADAGEEPADAPAQARLEL